GFPCKFLEGPVPNASMVRESRARGGLGGALQGPAASSEWVEKADALAERMERLLWYEDDRGGRYVALRWVHGVGSLEGEIVRSVDPDGTLKPSRSWVCFLPLYARVPSKEHALRILSR